MGYCNVCQPPQEIPDDQMAEHLNTEHAEELMLGDRFRYCVYCGADCWPDDPDHGDKCPVTTGVFPVSEREPELGCCKCGRMLAAGESYTHIDATGLPAFAAVRDRLDVSDAGMQVVEAVCLPCGVAALEAWTKA